MTDNKRFTLHSFGLNFIIRDNGKELSAKQIVDLLNENEQLKKDRNDYEDKLTFDEFKEGIIEIYNLFEEFCKVESHKLSKKNSIIRPVKIGYDIEYKKYGKYQLVLKLKKIDCEKFMPNICGECANYNNPAGCCELDEEPRDCSYFERIDE